jgi:hypothetical protein
MKIHYVVTDCGDGSSAVLWFKDEDVKALEDMLIDEQYEHLYQNEGCYETITLPDDVDLSKTGIRFTKPYK